MSSLRREILVPTAILSCVVVAALVVLGWDFARQAGALQAEADEVRAATALALALTDAAREEERWVVALATRAEAIDPSRLAAAADRVSRLLTRVEALPLADRAAEVWRRYVASREAIRPLAREVIAAAGRGDRAALAIALDQWTLVTDRADRLLRDFTAYHLNRLDRTVAELQRRRVRALAAAGLAVVAGLLLAAAFAVTLSRRVVRPIVEMAGAARRIQTTGGTSPVRGADRGDEIGVLARAFNEMTERLVSTNASLSDAVRARDEFISVASHELRTPLTPLLLRVQQLLRVTRDAPEGVLCRDDVVRSARNLDVHVVRLAKLVENLLDVSRINSGRLTLRPEPLLVGEAVRDALDKVAAELAAARCDVRVEGGDGLVVPADKTRFDQVLVNLLGNVAKYAPGAPVVVRISADDGFARVEVEDGGPGITPEDHRRIFNRFERAVPDRQVSGLGLGLYIAREIVHAHGGELTLRSEAGRGATFTVRLPRRANGADPHVGPGEAG